VSAPAFEFHITTLAGKAYEGSVCSLTLPGSNGYFGVLAHHAPLIASCGSGKLKLTDSESKTTVFETGAGFFQVVKNRAVLLASHARPVAA
jgi:F-type H+-transporting ATPase subunit epsilon